MLIAKLNKTATMPTFRTVHCVVSTLLGNTIILMSRDCQKTKYEVEDAGCWAHEQLWPAVATQSLRMRMVRPAEPPSRRAQLPGKECYLNFNLALLCLRSGLAHAAAATATEDRLLLLLLLLLLNPQRVAQLPSCCLETMTVTHSPLSSHPVHWLLLHGMAHLQRRLSA